MRKAHPFCKPEDVPDHLQQIELTDMEDAFLGKKMEKFLQYHDPEQSIFFLKSEIKMLQMRDWYCDGTFLIVKNIKYEQIYIISIFHNDGNYTFTYPVGFSFMTHRKIPNYNILFKFLSDTYFFETNEILTPASIRTDCEQAAISSAKEIFGAIKIRLCTVHIQRNWFKKLIDLVSKTLYRQTELLQTAWRIINGAFYLPVNYYPKIIEYLRYTTTPLLPETDDLQTRFLKFVEYLEKNYFSPSAYFHPSMWSYYTDISDRSEFNISTNPAESINKQLKLHCTTGTITFHKACDILKQFKTHYIQEHESRVRQNSLNRRRSVTVRRENDIENIISEHDYYVDNSANFTSLLEPPIDTIISFSYRLGNIGKTSNVEARLLNLPMSENNEPISD